MNSGSTVGDDAGSTNADRDLIDETVVSIEHSDTAEFAAARSADATLAAQLVADAADTAVLTRDSAAVVAALSVAAVAERTATALQAKAEATAQAVKDAAAQAAKDRARAVASGTLPSEAELAETVADEVRAKAAATAQETQRAAAVVATAVSKAAEKVVGDRGVSEHRTVNDVTAAKWNLERRTKDIASQVAERKAVHRDTVAGAARTVVAILTAPPG